MKFIPAPSLRLFLVFLSTSCFVNYVVSVLRQQTFQEILLLGQNTCITGGNQLASFHVDRLTQCAFYCVDQQCKAFNVVSGIISGLTCQLYSNVTYYGYDVNNCQAYQSVTVSALDFTRTAWLVVQTKVSHGSMSFTKNWIEYSNGFGNPNVSDNYWIGNKALNQLTFSQPGILRVEVQKNGIWYWAQYSSFNLSSAQTNYTLNVGGYSGNAGDALRTSSWATNWINNGQGFSTYDHGASSTCAGNEGWWFKQCSGSCINTLYNGSWTAVNNVLYDVTNSRMLFAFQ